MSAITIDNELVHYEVLGRGRPVILIHGWLGSWRYWIPTMQQLSMKYRTYALDLWGFGDSGKKADSYSFSGQVQLLLDFMDKLGIRKAAFVGHSLGAAIAMRICELHADRVPRVMPVCMPLVGWAAPELYEQQDDQQIDIPLDASGSLDLEALQRQAEALGAASLGTEANLSETEPSSAETHPTQSTSEQARELLERLNGGTASIERFISPDTPEFERLQAEIEKADVEARLASARSLVDEWDVTESLLQSKVPTVMVYGETDPLVSVPSDDWLEKLRAGGSFHGVLLNEAGHFPMLEERSRFNRLLMDFLEAKDISSLQLREQWVRRTR
jgi:pimeloyl-ACP methyl ester carboxylesterase